MEYKPFTTKQKNVISAIAAIVASWATSNDISSPTMQLDIWEDLKRVGWENGIPIEPDLNDLERKLCALLNSVKNVDRYTQDIKPN